MSGIANPTEKIMRLALIVVLLIALLSLPAAAETCTPNVQHRAAATLALTPTASAVILSPVPQSFATSPQTAFPAAGRA
jgi:hypothetical protein